MASDILIFQTWRDSITKTAVNVNSHKHIIDEYPRIDLKDA